jgi:hypothetical protein
MAPCSIKPLVKTKKNKHNKRREKTKKWNSSPAEMATNHSGDKARPTLSVGKKWRYGLTVGE